MELTRAEVQQKFDECFRLGVNPMRPESIDALGARVQNLERVGDMSRFFDSISQ